MAPITEKSSLKRSRLSADDVTDSKKPRRSERIQSQTRFSQTHLPSPLTHKDSTATEDIAEATASPPSPPARSNGRGSAGQSPSLGLSSPPSDTQAYSQFVFPPKSRLFSYEVEDEEAEKVWGYLVPVSKADSALVLRPRNVCETRPADLGQAPKGPVERDFFDKREKQFDEEARGKMPSKGYLLGRHPECDRVIEGPTVSNRHCVVFNEIKGGNRKAIVEDLSANGTFVNEAFIGRNKRRELKDGDEIAIVDAARFVFRYPQNMHTDGFRQQFTIQEQLGKGHFATVYLCIERSTGTRFAVKKFEKRNSPSERSKMEGLQQEIAVLMSVNHPSLLCLKATFDETDAVFLVLELAPEGELFNYIITKHKLTEAEARNIFCQLLQGLKYLHERSIVHRDIKPENILLADKKLTIKLADFGLAKIIGEDSFTTTLCGTPSYVAPEILKNTHHRRYTKAVDVWSLGVVLYICLCGFPPFSDELCTRENPLTMSEQIETARFDYPSPYWDSVGDPALDLIDRMLTVDVEKRITVEQCLQHPWITKQELSLTDSTDGLTGAMCNLDFSKRKLARERTLLSSLNDVRIKKVIETQTNALPVTVYEKNPNSQSQRSSSQPRTKYGEYVASQRAKEATPTNSRNPNDFMSLGDKGDPILYANDEGSIYTPDRLIKANQG